MSHLLPRSARLSCQDDFESVFAKAKKAKSAHLYALYLTNQLPRARLGVRLSKHRVKRAVDRNLLKRLIRESFRQYQDRLKGLDIIVLIQSKWTPLDNADWRNEIDHLWQLIIGRSQ